MLVFAEFQLKREKKTYCFESAPCEVSDRFAIEFLASTSQDLHTVTIRIMDAGPPDKLSYSAETCAPVEGHSVVKEVFTNDLVNDFCTFIDLNCISHKVYFCLQVVR